MNSAHSLISKAPILDNVKRAYRVSECMTVKAHPSSCHVTSSWSNDKDQIKNFHCLFYHFVHLHIHIPLRSAHPVLHYPPSTILSRVSKPHTWQVHYSEPLQDNLTQDHTEFESHMRSYNTSVIYNPCDCHTGQKHFKDLITSSYLSIIQIEARKTDCRSLSRWYVPRTMFSLEPGSSHHTHYVCRPPDQAICRAP